MKTYKYSKVKETNDIPAGGGCKEKGNIFSRVTLGWLDETIERAKDGSLHENNLGEILDMKSTEEITNRLQDEWKREVDRASNAGKKPRLWKAVLRSIDTSVIIRTFLFGILDSTGRILQTVFLSVILYELALSVHASMISLCLYASSITLFCLVENMSRNEQYHHEVLTAVQIRAALTGLIQRKLLTLSSGSLARISSGHVISLASQELEPIVLAGSDLHGLVVVPLEVITVSLLLWYLVGWQVVPAMGYLLLIVVSKIYLGNFIKTLKSERGDWTARRLRHVSDIIFGIRSIKANTWEDLMIDRVSKERRKELQNVWHLGTVHSAFDSAIVSYPVLTTVIAVSSLVLFGQQLTPQKVFSTIALFGVLNATATHLFIKTVVFLSYSISSLEKVSRFLLEGDVDLPTKDCPEVDRPPPKGLPRRTEWSVLQKKPSEQSIAKITLHEISTCLVKDEQSFQLKKISLKASGDQFIGITGPVGSGKSCILHSIINDLHIDQGKIHIQGKLLIVPQVPWVFSGTIRDNILFGQPLETEKYEQILDACALNPDLETFPKGDLTYIGERGISLSGGQQTRVTLARAAYADADIYLLDDTLSAVDSKVGQHIFKSCFNGILSDRLCILATHQVQYLETADHILVLDNGAVISEGTYSELCKRDNFFSKLITDQGKSDGNRRLPGAWIENPSGKLFYRPEDGGVERAVEDKAKGAVSLYVYWQYFRAGVNIFALSFFGLIAILPEGMSIAFFLWLTNWTASRATSGLNYKLKILAAFAGATVIFAIVRSVNFFWITTRSTKHLHEKMLKAVLHAPVRFFDTNPYGRIQNRFSKDVATMDDFLPRHLSVAMIYVFFFVGTLALISITYPWLILSTIPYLLITVYVGSKGIRSGREIKRTEAITNSLVYEHISDCIQGVVSIRAYGMEKVFTDKHHRNQDTNNKAIAASLFVFRWIAFRLGLVSVVLVTAVVVASLILIKDPALCGLVITFAIQLNKKLSTICFHLTFAETSMVSVERVLAYTKLETETGYSRATLPAKHWPEHRSVTLKNLYLVYYPNGPRVLKDLSCSIKASEKIGIVGRTGAGKSSLMAAFLRMPEPQGEVIIDDVMTSAINIRALRGAVAVIPQRPFIFNDTLRRNLDPWVQHSDTDIWAVLEKVQLKSMVGSRCSSGAALQLVITGGGQNLSVGERQLICLARAFLQKAKIIVLDEATANIDYLTDRMIQDVIRKEMSHCTVLTIAHRLDTVLEYDRIMVLENGRIVEFDKPDILLQNKDGFLSELYFSFQAGKEEF